MFKLDENLLIELGLGGLPPEEKNKMLAHIYETLELRVGMRLANAMSDAQLQEFEALMPVQGDAEAVIRQKEQQSLAWLQTNFPNYKEVVAQELEKLKTEIKTQSAQIVEATLQHDQTSPPPAA